MQVGPNKDGPGTFEHYKRADRGPWISTVTGRKFYYRDPTPDMVDIYDIACASSKICRYTGQIEEFYSVAEHSWFTSYLVPRPWALQALLHDATEAYVQDLARPLKRLLPDYKEIEDRIWALAIAPKFNLPRIMSPIVKKADMAMFAAEVPVLQPWVIGDPDYDMGPEPAAPVKLHLWEHKEARAMFTARYRELTSLAA